MTWHRSSIVLAAMVVVGLLGFSPAIGQVAEAARVLTCESLFADVSSYHWACAYVETVAAATYNIMPPCSNVYFCPSELVLRDDMALHLERALRGPSYAPPAATGVFNDVPSTYGLAAFIEKLARDKITTGCPGTALYCPAKFVLRSEMAMFIARAQMVELNSLPENPWPPPDDPLYLPTADSGLGYDCRAGGTSLFQDVAPTDQWCRHVHYLLKTGVTTGCAQNPRRYCPGNYVTRAEMATFMKRAFVAPD